MKEIAFDEFYRLYQKESLSVLDVREVEEFKRTLHLEGVQESSAQSVADSLQLDKDLLHYVIVNLG